MSVCLRRNLTRVCILYVWVCDGKHSSFSAVIPTSIISISHSSLSYRGREGGKVFRGEMEVRGLSRWKKNTAYQISAKRLCNLRRQAAKHITVQPTKSTPEEYLFCSRNCNNPRRYITLPSLSFTLSQETQRSEQTAKQERKQLQSKQSDSKANQEKRKYSNPAIILYAADQTAALPSKCRK